jgi:hypothetical protein
MGRFIRQSKMDWYLNFVTILQLPSIAALTAQLSYIILERRGVVK